LLNEILSTHTKATKATPGLNPIRIANTIFETGFMASQVHRDDSTIYKEIRQNVIKLQQKMHTYKKRTDFKSDDKSKKQEAIETLTRELSEQIDFFINFDKDQRFTGEISQNMKTSESRYGPCSNCQKHHDYTNRSICSVLTIR
jgi:predicted lactoylglutathione lyase